MKLLILSDLHTEFATFEVPKDMDYDVAILAGDIGVPGDKMIRWARRESTFGRAKAVIVVAGNHEFYGTVMERQIRAMRAACEGSRVCFLDGDCCVIDGVRFLGCTLWTDFALGIARSNGSTVSDWEFAVHACREGMTDYQVIRTLTTHGRNVRKRALQPVDTLAIHRAQRAWLLAALQEPFEGPTVVVTHHAPNRQSVPHELADSWLASGYVSELPNEFFDVPALWVHGHTHTSFDYRVGNCRVVCNPRGYSNTLRKKGTENERFDPRFIVEVEGAATSTLDADLAEARQQDTLDVMTGRRSADATHFIPDWMARQSKPVFPKKYRKS